MHEAELMHDVRYKYRVHDAFFVPEFWSDRRLCGWIFSKDDEGFDGRV